MTDSTTQSGEMTPSSDLFESVYRGESVYGKRPPWEIERPQPAFVDLQKAGALQGAVFDAGCGTGETSLYLASNGLSVTGVDFSAAAIASARAKAEQRGLSVTFEVDDVLNLKVGSELFDTVVDSGTARMFGSGALATYAAELHRICLPGAVAHVLAINEPGMKELQSRLADEIEGIPKEIPKDAVGSNGLQLTVEHVRDGFAKHWTVESITDSAMNYMLPSGKQDILPSAWLYRFRRI